MSAITGIFFLNQQPVDPSELQRVTEILAHRGPDGQGIWVEGAVGLGHRMLWTTPESLREVLPFARREAKLAITADARIDNREELIRVLGLTDRPAAELSDSELILYAYERWGEECPVHLLGDFAFAIWDGRKRQLFCARDPMGVKPFFYHQSGKLFAFASEIKALIGVAGIPCRLNEVRVADYLFSQFDDIESTFYQDILRLPPAARAWVGENGMRIERYWRLDPSRELRLRSDAEYAEQFREIFTRAVQCRLRSALPIGSQLSGGLDSSSVTCVARNLHMDAGKGMLRTFSAIFSEVSVCDEQQYIDLVAAQGGIKSHFIHGDQSSPLHDIGRMLWHQDEALFAYNLSLNWNLLTAAKEEGIRVMLDGFDGDTTVSHGVGYLTELALAGRWLTAAREARGVARHRGERAWAWLWPLLWHYGLNPTSSCYRPIRLVGRIWRTAAKRAGLGRTSIQLPEGTPPVNPEFFVALNVGERLNTLWGQRPGAPRTEREAHYRLLTAGTMVSTLEALDRTAAAFGIEPRYPFCDRRLVEFCLALPAEQKLHDGWGRMVMRRAMEGILPPAIQWRGGKSNLAPQFVHTFLAFERERLDEMVLRNPGFLQRYFDLPALQEACRRLVEPREQAAAGDILVVWKAVSLALWLRHAGLAIAGHSGRR